MTPHLDATEEAAIALIMRGIEGPVVMLNLLRFRETADYSHAPDLTPSQPIGGSAAYTIYMQEMGPLLANSGGKVLFSGDGGPFLIGPPDEKWDYALLVEQASVASFLAFAQDPEAQRILRHRTAALADSRLLPLAPHAMAARA